MIEYEQRVSLDVSNAIKISKEMNTNWLHSTYSKYTSRLNAQCIADEIARIRNAVLESEFLNPLDREEIFLGFFHFPGFDITKNRRPQVTIKQSHSKIPTSGFSRS